MRLRNKTIVAFSVLVYRTQYLTHWHIANVIFSLSSSLILFLFTPDLFRTRQQ